MVRTAGTGRGDLPVFPDSPAYLGPLVQPVPTVTVTHQLATSKQELPTSLWMWRDLLGTKGHSGRDRKTVGLSPLSTQHFSSVLPGGCGRRGAFVPLTSSLANMFFVPATSLSERASLFESYKKKQQHICVFFLCACSVVFFYLRDVLIYSWLCSYFWYDQK